MMKSTPIRGVKSTWNHMLTSCRSTLEVWLRAFCIMILRVVLCCKAKLYPNGAEGKPSLKRAHSSREQTRNLVIYPWAGWRRGKTLWRTERTYVEKWGDDLWGGVKVLSNQEISRSLRNSFRASLALYLLEVELLDGAGGPQAYPPQPNSECQ